MLQAMRISFALVMLTSCILLTAEIMGFTPQENKYLVESRSKLSESLALQMSVLLPEKDIRKIRKLIRYIVKRNSEILSAGIRRESGSLIFQSGKHEQLWRGYDDDVSTSTHILVPMLQNDRLWGNVELRFEALKGESILGFFNQSIFKLIIFISLFGFFVFLVFMLRTLRQLDPSAVIPERVNAAFDTLAEGVIIVDEKEQILLANKAFCDKIGQPENRLIGHKVSELQWAQVSAQKSGKEFPWKKVIETGKSIIGTQLIYKKAKNEHIKFAINASPIISDNNKPQGVLITLDDISELEKTNSDLKNVVAQLQKTQFHVQQQNKKLSYLATRDALTGCLNRRSFTEQFETLFEKAKQEKQELSCIMVDIDHFKSVNDNYGHAVGDEVIKLLAEILENNSRKDDLVARYGGEEFCLVLPGMSVDVAINTAERIRLRIKDASDKRWETGPRVTASLGVASIFDDPQTPAQLVNYADEALYVAKESGRNQVVRWTPAAEKIPEIHEKQVEEQTTEAVRDVAELKTRIQELEQMASGFSAELEYNQSHDALTGLPNQVLFYDRINQALGRGYRYDLLAAMLVIDIEMFSNINTTLGRSVGDKLLQEFSQLLNRTFRKSDGVSRLTVSRFAGDEFAVLLTDMEQQDQVTWAVKRFFDATQDAFVIEDNTIHVNAKIGISLYPTDASSTDELFSHAITANKYCKQNTMHSNYHFFDQHMQELSQKHLQLEKEIYKAIEQEQWHLLYQPKLDINQKRVTGVEALIRWKHPKRGLVTPFEFIEFAEQRKLIIPIGDWVIRQACKQIRKFIAQGITNCKVAINLSPVQLVQSDIVQKVFNAIDEFDVPPCLFEIEITETALMKNIQVASESLKRLNARGISISIDDFGTGYSSLSYLKNLPIDSLKIDRSFIKDICHDKNDEQIVKTLISMAHSLGLRVVAEGVEDKQQFKLMNHYGCDDIQGYLLSKPVEAQELSDIINHPNQLTNTESGVYQLRS